MEVKESARRAPGPAMNKARVKVGTANRVILGGNVCILAEFVVQIMELL